MAQATIKVIFLKDRIYNNNNYKIGDIIRMWSKDVKAYLDCNVVKLYIEKKELDIENMPYNKIRELCTKNNIPAVGKKEDLIVALKEKLNSKK